MLGLSLLVFVEKLGDGAPVMTVPHAVIASAEPGHGGRLAPYHQGMRMGSQLLPFLVSPLWMVCWEVTSCTDKGVAVTQGHVLGSSVDQLFPKPRFPAASSWHFPPVESFGPRCPLRACGVGEGTERSSRQPSDHGPPAQVSG